MADLRELGSSLPPSFLSLSHSSASRNCHFLSIMQGTIFPGVKWLALYIKPYFCNCMYFFLVHPHSCTVTLASDLLTYKDCPGWLVSCPSLCTSPPLACCRCTCSAVLGDLQTRFHLTAALTACLCLHSETAIFGGLIYLDPPHAAIGH